MRVRPQRPAGRRRPSFRRAHALGHQREEVPEPEAPAPDPGPPMEVPEGPRSETFAGHLEERRHRASVRPEDHALYRCQCGFQFEASVSASVACPHCGTGLAW